MSKTNGNKPVQVQDQAEDLLKNIIAGKVSFDMPTPDLLDPPPSAGSATTGPDQAAAVKTPPEPSSEAIWKRKDAAKVKTTVRRCIVIDREDHWHQEAMVDLKGVDATAFTWGYYGQSLPVLIESAEKSGVLNPWYFQDAAGESSNRLFKGANPDGFKSTFKHRSNLLQKIQIGLMVALVLGLFFIMFILINQ